MPAPDSSASGYAERKKCPRHVVRGSFPLNFLNMGSIMKLSILLVAASALSALSLPAAAQDHSQPITSVPVAGQRGGAYKMDADQYHEFKGGYSLSNGKVLHLVGSHRSMFAYVDDQPIHRIVATGPHSFAAVGHLMTMTLDISDPFAVSGELIYVDESQRQSSLAAVPARVVRLAIR